MSEKLPRKPLDTPPVASPEENILERKSNEPIVMVNPVLSRQAGLKEKKRRKSISEGGDAYVPIVLERTFNDEVPSPPDALETSTVNTLESPKAYKEKIRETVSAVNIEAQIQKRREYIKMLEEEAKNPKLKLSGPFAPQRSIEQRIVDAEDKLRMLEKRKNEGALTAANDNEKQSPALENFNKNIKPALVLKTEGRIAAMPQSSQDVFKRLFPSGNAPETRKRSAKFRAAAFAAIATLGAGGYAAADLHSAHAGQPAIERTKSSESFTPITVKAGHGDGVEHMFKHLQRQLKEHHAHSTLAKYLIGQDPDKLASGLKFVEYHKDKLPQSARIHIGDSFTVNEHDQLVFHNHATNKDILLMHTDAAGTHQIDNLYSGPRSITVHHHISQAKYPAETRALATVGGAANELPPGIDPDSAAAADILRAHHNPAPDHKSAPVSTPSPAPEHTPATPEQTPPAQSSPAIDHSTPVSTDHAPAVATNNSKEAGDAGLPPIFSERTMFPLKDILDSGAYASDADAYSVFSTPPNPDEIAAGQLRSELFDIMRKSGVGPLQNQSLEDYLKIATKAIHDRGDQSPDSFDARPGIYETPDHHLQAHGGDVSARLMLANEYHMENPSLEILVENPGGRPPFYKFSPWSAGYTPSSGSHIVITPSDKLVF